MVFKTKSSWFSLFMNGKIEHIINPWVLTVNFENETITVEKRNWFFFGKDKNIVSFRFIRNIQINEHLFGGDISIKVMGSGMVSGCYFPKWKLNKIKNLMIEYNQTKKHSIIFS
jgi:hypothetical protein